MPLRLMLIEDDLADFLLIERHLGRHGLDVECHRVASDPELDAALCETWDAVLSDYHLPGMNFQQVLAKVRARWPELPILLISGSIGEEVAIDLLKLGIWDFVLKERLARLVPAIQRALREVAERRALKAAEQALAIREAQYQAAVETATDGFCMLDDQGRILTVNDAFARRSGYSREELLAMSIADLEAQESPADVRAHLEKIRHDGSDLFETRHRTKDGDIWPAEVSGSYWATAGGRFLGFLRDITERKRAESELQSLRAEMEEVMRFHVASQTVAAIAHELNQPLNAVVSYSEAALRMLRAGNPRPDRLQHALERNSEQALRAGQVVRELLAFMNKGEVKAESTDLNDIVRLAMTRIGTDVHAGFPVRLELQPDLAKVSADSLQVEKVLVNLLQNGIEAMRDGGISPRSVTITVRTCADGNMAQVTVRDSGPGIDAQTLRRVFDPFFTTKPKGLGMGLPISRAIIEAHGGQLWVESEPGSGASFHFTLPFAA